MSASNGGGGDGGAAEPPLPNRLGAHALCWVGGWSRGECVEAISSAAVAGYDVIEIPALDPSRIDVDHTRSVLERYGMRATVTLGLSRDADVSSSDPRVARKGEDRLHAALDVAARLGGDYLGGVLYSALGRYDRPPTEEERDNSVAAIRRVAVAARERGVTLGLEIVNRYESNLINTARQCLDYIAEVGEPNVVVHLDVYHMNIEEADLRSPVLECGDRLGYVHIGASHRGPLGTGNIDFDEFFGALAEIDYRGTVTFESFSSEVMDPDLSSTLCIWRNLWDDSDELTRNAREYMVEKIRKARIAALP